MPVPSLQKFMLPVLQVADKVQEPIHRRDLLSPVCDLMGISQEDREVYSAGGRTTRVRDRISWAKTYLVRAGLLERPTRGYISITDAGRKVLQENLDEITTKYLIENFPEFDNFASKKNTLRPEPVTRNTDSADGSPYERIGEAIEDIQRSLREDLIDRIQNLTPKAFEQLILELVLKMDYGSIENSKRTGQSGDGGIDGIIRDGRLGLDPIYLQAKRYARDNHVGVNDVNSFIGAVDRRGSNKGVFVTTSSFSKPAIEAVKETQKEIRLIDGDELTKLMVRYEVGVRVEETHTIKKLDSDYFDELDEE